MWAAATTLTSLATASGVKFTTLPRRRLGLTDLEVSILGYGGTPLGNQFGVIDEGEGIASVHAAIESEINFFDVSPYYGSTLAETVLGKALKTVPREKFILASKVGRYGLETFDFSAKRVKESVEESMNRLHVDCIDLIQCHDIEFGDIEMIASETIPALLELKAAGKVRYIGITGLPLKVFDSTLKLLPRVESSVAETDRLSAPTTAVDTVLSYCHYCLNDRSLETQIPTLVNSYGLGVINASPLSMGMLTKGGPPDWHPAPQEVKETCRKAAVLLETKWKVDIAKVALQFSVTSNPLISTTLVGMNTRQLVEQNVNAVLEACNYQRLPNELLQQDLDSIFAPILNVTWPSGRDEKLQYVL